MIKEGLTVPEYSQEVQSGQIGTKRKRWTRAMQMFAGYLVGAWTIVQFVDWILNRYQISPYWTDILLLLFVGVVPSLLIYLVNQDRIHERILLQREKIIILLNIFLLLGAITFAYGGTDLGSINKNISFDDINGNAINQEIVKNEFRTSLLIFPFTQQKGADTTHWIGNALSTCLMTDVTQDKYLNIHYHQAQEQVDKINSARLRDIKYYVDGSFSLLETGFEITPTVRDGRNGKVLKEKVFRGPDFFTLVDSISIYLRQAIGLKQAQIDESIDLNVSDYITDNFEAFKYFSKGAHDIDLASIEKAIELDTTFVVAMLSYASILDLRSKGQLEAKLYLERAMQYRKKLPLRYQVLTMTFNYLLNDELEKAEKLINIQLEFSLPYTFNPPKIRESSLKIGKKFEGHA